MENSDQNPQQQQLQPQQQQQGGQHQLAQPQECCGQVWRTSQGLKKATDATATTDTKNYFDEKLSGALQEKIFKSSFK